MVSGPYLRVMWGNVVRSVHAMFNGDCYDPLFTLLAVPILAIWRQQAVDLQRSMMSSDYPHLAPGVDIKALLRLMGTLLSFRYSHTLFVNAPTHLHTHDTHPRIFENP